MKQHFFDVRRRRGDDDFLECEVQNTATESIQTQAAASLSAAKNP